MKIAVRYYTKTGNTKRLAEAVAKAVGVEALPIDTPITEPVDILFLGNSYYVFSIDPEVRSFVQSLDKSKVGKIVNVFKRNDPLSKRVHKEFSGLLMLSFFSLMERFVSVEENADDDLFIRK